MLKPLPQNGAFIFGRQEKQVRKYCSIHQSVCQVFNLGSVSRIAIYLKKETP